MRRNRPTTASTTRPHLSIDASRRKQRPNTARTPTSASPVALTSRSQPYALRGTPRGTVQPARTAGGVQYNPGRYSRKQAVFDMAGAMMNSRTLGEDMARLGQKLASSGFDNMKPMQGDDLRSPARSPVPGESVSFKQSLDKGTLTTSTTKRPKSATKRRGSLRKGKFKSPPPMEEVLSAQGPTSGLFQTLERIARENDPRMKQQPPIEPAALEVNQSPRQPGTKPPRVPFARALAEASAVNLEVLAHLSNPSTPTGSRQCTPRVDTAVGWEAVRGAVRGDAVQKLLQQCVYQIEAALQHNVGMEAVAGALQAVVQKWEQRSAGLPEFGSGRPRKRDVEKTVMNAVKEAWVSALQRLGNTASAALTTCLMKERGVAEAPIKREKESYLL